MIDNTSYAFGDFFKESQNLLRGVSRAADTLCAAYGPARLDTRRSEQILKTIESGNSLEGRGIDLMRPTALRDVGNVLIDGVITAALLVETLLTGASAAIVAGSNPADLAADIGFAVQTATAHLTQHARTLQAPSWVRFIATDAAGYDQELGQDIANLVTGGTDPENIRVYPSNQDGIQINGTDLVIGSLPGMNVSDRVSLAQTTHQSLNFARNKGVVAGGGVALLDAADALPALDRPGIEIVRQALSRPANELALRATATGYQPLKRTVGYGLDVLAGNAVDMFEAAIVDPLPILQYALLRSGRVTLAYLRHIQGLPSSPQELKFPDLEPWIFESRFARDPDPWRQHYNPDSAPGYFDLGIQPAQPYSRNTAFLAGNFFRAETSLLPPNQAPDGVDPPAHLENNASPAAAAVPEPEPEDRYLIGNLPSRTSEDESIDLIVRVSGSTMTGHADKLKMLVPPEGATLDIVVSASNFQIDGPSTAKLFVPGKGDSALVGFRLRALKPEAAEPAAEVHVAAVHQGSTVASLTLTVTVTSAKSAEPATESKSKFSQNRIRPGEVSLFVDFHKPSQTFSMRWFDSDGGPEELAYTERVFNDLEDVIKRKVSDIEEIVRLDYTIAADAARTKLKAFGSELWDLLPEKIRDRAIAQWDKLERVTIYSGGDPFPWEMLYPYRREPRFDRNSFFVEKAQVCRWIYGRLAPCSIAVERADFVVADPAQLQQARDEVGAFTQALSIWNAALEPKSVDSATDFYDLFDQKQLSLLHVACHQSLDGNNERIILGNTPVGPKDLYNAQPGALHFIFLNACRSDQKVPSYNQIGGWATAFLKIGVGAFVGTLWEVRDQTAQLFAQTFYNELLIKRGTVGHALAHARATVKKNAPGDPTWLAYSFYGNTEARFETPNATEIGGQEPW